MACITSGNNMVKLVFRLTKFAKISGKYVLFDVAVFDLQYTLLVR